MRVPADLSDVLLTVAGRDFAVRLHDESSGGMCVIVEEDVPIAVGDLLQIGTRAGWFEVKVMRIESVPAGRQVGLQRGREVTAAERRRASLGVSRWTLAAAAALGLLIIPAATGAWFYRPAPPPAAVPPPAAKSPAAKSSPPAQAAKPAAKAPNTRTAPVQAKAFP
jgi:hypothetical protein